MKPLSTLALTLFVFSVHGQAVLVQDLAPGIQGSHPRQKYVVNGKMAFHSISALSAYNDTTVSKVLGMPNTVYRMAVANDVLYFVAEKPGGGYELNKWDGISTPKSVTNTPVSTVFHHAGIVEHNNKIYYTVGGPAGWELWKHDPAANIAKRLTDSVDGHYPFVFNNRIYFFRVHLNGSYSLRKIAMYDPALDMVLDETNIKVNPYPLNQLTQFNTCYNKLYFEAASNDYGRELYVYDGMTIPLRITDINPGPASSVSDSLYWDSSPSIIGYKDKVYFTASNGGTAYQLYRYDPKRDVGPANPSFVYNINVPGGDTKHFQFIEYNGNLYFPGSDSAHGKELWMYDGLNDPFMIADINAGKASGNPMYFVVYKNNLYFTATNSKTGEELYRLHRFPASIENVNKVNSLTVYPNPTTNQLHFTIDLKEASAFAITLTDITGREVYSGGMQHHSAGKATVQADVSALAGGDYIYRITTSEGVALGSGKVVKE